MQNIVFVTSVDQAKQVAATGSLPAVDVSTVQGGGLSYELHKIGVKQATMQQIIVSGVHP